MQGSDLNAGSTALSSTICAAAWSVPKARPKPAVDLVEVLGSWELHLRAERKSPQTVRAYGDGVRTYLAWCERAGRPTVLDRRQLREFVDALLTEGAKPATAVSRHLAV